jgi:hypothetical protein
MQSRIFHGRSTIGFLAGLCVLAAPASGGAVSSGGGINPSYQDLVVCGLAPRGGAPAVGWQMHLSGERFGETIVSYLFTLTRDDDARLTYGIALRTPPGNWQPSPLLPSGVSPGEGDAGVLTLGWRGDDVSGTLTLRNPPPDLVMPRAAEFTADLVECIRFDI